MGSTASIHLFDHAVAGAAQWLDEVATALGTDDHRHAKRVLRAVLHAVRDRLEPNEAAQLAAQMPEPVRGMYYDGWSPSHGARGHREAFLQSIADAAGLHASSGSCSSLMGCQMDDVARVVRTATVDATTRRRGVAGK